MEIFNNVFSKVSDAGQKLGNTAKTKLKVAQYQADLKSAQEKINDIFRLVGANVYDSYEKKRGGEF